MLIFWQPRIVFLANPKAASTAIEAALESLATLTVDRPAVLKHVDVRGYRQHVDPWLRASAQDIFQTVALIREPVSWLSSWYRFRMIEDTESEHGRMEGVSFDDFVRDYCEGSGQGPARDITSQADFLGPGVDQLFRYEEMEKFTVFLEDALDCEILLPRVNVPPSADTKLSPTCRTLLEQKLARDFETYATV